MAELVVENLTIQYRDTVAVRDLDLHVRSGEFVTLLGPSGCGKTTTLRCIAGLQPSVQGTIRIGGAEVAGPSGEIPPERRNVNMVFQSYAVWPHMTVFENVAFGLKLLKLPRAEVRRRAEQALDLVDLAEYAGRYGTELSGGQQQRAALARAIATEPALLLLDEPLSNLDAALREQTRVELRDLHDRIGKTALYVTHDQTEAMAMSDKVVLMHDGRIVQQGPPRELFERPRNRFAAQFLGFANIWEGVVRERDSSGEVDVVLEGDGLRMSAQVVDDDAPHVAGTRGAVAVRAERVAIDDQEPAGTAHSTWKGRVERMSYLGSAAQYEVSVGSRTIRAETHPHHTLAPGDDAWVSIEPVAVVWLSEPVADGATSAVAVGVE